MFSFGEILQLAVQQITGYGLWTAGGHALFCSYHAGPHVLFGTPAREIKRAIVPAIHGSAMLPHLSVGGPGCHVCLSVPYSIGSAIWQIRFASSNGRQSRRESIVDTKRNPAEGQSRPSLEPAAGTSNVSGLAGIVPACFARKVTVGNDCVLVVNRGFVVFGGIVYGIAALERGRHSIASRGAAEIHAVRTVLSARYRRLQTVGPAEVITRFSLARVSLSLLRHVRSVFRKSADRDRVVHLFRHRFGSLPFPGTAHKSHYPSGPNCRPILVRHLCVALFRDLAWVLGRQTPGYPVAIHDFPHNSDICFGNPLSRR